MEKLGPTEFMKTLGDTSEEVADSIRKFGITGTKGSRRCPLAKALKEHSNCGYTIGVSAHGDVYYDDLQVLDPDTPTAVKQFVRDFDNDKYPDLLEKGWHGFYGI